MLSRKTNHQQIGNTLNVISALGLPVVLPVTASGVILLAGSSIKALQVQVFNSNRLTLCAAPGISVTATGGLNVPHRGS